MPADKHVQLFFLHHGLIALNHFTLLKFSDKSKTSHKIETAAFTLAKQLTVQLIQQTVLICKPVLPMPKTKRAPRSN